MFYSYEYKTLNEILNLYKFSSENLENVYILGCQHVLEPQAKMIEMFNEFGVPKENIFIFGKIYSTSNEVLKYLRENNFNVYQPEFNQKVSFDIQHLENCKNEFKKFIQLTNNPKKIIIVDDGGDLLRVVNDNFDLIHESVSVVGVEQTSSGFRKLENAKINFPIFNVARSSLKLVKESPLIADLGCRRVFDVFDKYHIQDKRILVVGLGPIGANMMKILEDKKYFVLGYDIAHHEEKDLIDLITDNDINVVIGAVGANILNDGSLYILKNKIKERFFLISMSSADREFPSVFIREGEGFIKSGVHDDIIWENIVLVNNGFPITFKGNRFESTPEEIEKTIGLLLGSTLSAIKNDIKESGFIEVDNKIIDIIEKHESN